ncbi:MAG: response regulator transcription factor [Gemmatimonadota bacterium]|nr:response regulator transcription factor [Gemmatimonadota bacterium]
MSTIRVVIADDHAVVREGLGLFLSEEAPDIELVGHARTGAEALERVVELQPDVVLMDLVMPKMDGLEAMRQLRAAGTRARVIVLTTYIEEAKVREALGLGAVGYLLKDVGRDDLTAAIRAAHEGRTTLHPDAQQMLVHHLTAPVRTSPLEELTERERDVLKLIASGMSNKAIAKTLFLSVGTVKGYVSAVLAKLGVSDRTQAALVAVREGLVDVGADA